DVERGGLALLAALREARSAPAVVLLASSASARLRSRALTAGAADVLTKPFPAEELLARVAIALRNAEIVAAARAATRVDSLTGLGSRAFLDEELHEGLARARRQGHDLAL